MTRRTSRRLLLAASVLALLSCSSTPEPASAQQITSVAVKKVENTLPGPKLTAYANGVRSKATERELGLRALDISVDVRGDIAETIVTASFENPTSELLEGQFQINMARGAVVTGYALDINGTLIDGVLETKYKAAEAYQRRVTQRIDPGLAEVDYSDKFEARIYPIPARGARTIRLKMVSQFDPSEGYVLPLSLAGEVRRFKLSIDGEAKVISLPKGLSGAGVIEAENVKLHGALQLGPADRAAPMLVSQHPGAERFFDITAPAPRAAAEQRHPLHIFWDRSVSRADDALKQEAQLAEDFALKRGLRRVTVTLFDSGKSETIEVDADRLSEKLDDVRYRGGTSYATLTATKITSGADCLMFSDGRVSIDDRTGFLLPCSVTTITSGPESDRAWLGDLAERTGGALLTLTKKNASEVLTQMLKPASILSVTDGAGHSIEAVRLAADPRNFHIVGALPDDGVVLVRVAGEASPRRFTQTSSRTPTFSGPGALWARQRLGVEATEKKPDDLAAMARRYNVATPQASFVVLETPNDYVQSKIEPPSSYPKEMQLTYASLRKSADAQESRAKEDRMTQVVMMWDQQKKWWSTKFDGKVSKDEEKRAAAEGGARDSDDRPRPTASAPPPPPPPPPPATMARPDAGAGERVVVTGSLANRTPQDAALPVQVYSQDELRANGAPGGDEAETDSGRSGTISVADWNADRPYLDRLDKAGANWEAQIDKEMKTPEGVLPLFWFDVAEWHWRAGRKDEARRAAEAALDMPARDNQTLAIVASRLSRYGSHDRAVWLLERLMEREPDRPQPMRTLGMALIERAKFSNATDAAKADLGRAIELLSKAATGVYEQPARGVEVVTLMEANAALAKLKRMGGTSKALDERLVALLDADVRVVMEWNTPRTDLDLWVTEPKGAKVGYSSPLSSWGGKLSGDVTTGYGPEEYAIRTANNGAYHVRAKTFASDRANPNGPSSLTVRLIRNFGRPSQSEELIDLEMAAEDRGEIEVGKFTIE